MLRWICPARMPAFDAICSISTAYWPGQRAGPLGLLGRRPGAPGRPPDLGVLSRPLHRHRRPRDAAHAGRASAIRRATGTSFGRSTPPRKQLFQRRMAAAPPFPPALDGLLAELHAALQTGGGEFQRVLRRSNRCWRPVACAAISTPWWAATTCGGRSRRRSLTCWPPAPGRCASRWWWRIPTRESPPDAPRASKCCAVPQPRRGPGPAAPRCTL